MAYMIIIGNLTWCGTMSFCFFKYYFIAFGESSRKVSIICPLLYIPRASHFHLGFSEGDVATSDIGLHIFSPCSAAGNLFQYKAQKYTWLCYNYTISNIIHHEILSYQQVKPYLITDWHRNWHYIAPWHHDAGGDWTPFGPGLVCPWFLFLSKSWVEVHFFIQGV
jgi:hypothetical protein